LSPAGRPRSDQRTDPAADRRHANALCGPRMPAPLKRRNAGWGGLTTFFRSDLLVRRQGGVGGASSGPRAGGVAGPARRLPEAVFL